MKKQIFLSAVSLILLFAVLTSCAFYFVDFSNFRSVVGALGSITVVSALIALIVSKKTAEKIAKRFNEYDFDTDINASPLYDEAAPLVRRINALKRKHEKNINRLKTRTTAIENIANDMKEGVILADANNNVLIANKSVSEIFEEPEMINKNMLEICRDVEFQSRIKKCSDGESSEMLYERGGKIYSVFFNPSYLGDKGAVNGTVILFFDATEKFRAEKQRREFSANVSHELKTPLTTISGLSEMLENGMAKEEDVKSFAGKITVQAKRLQDIINDIIKLSEFDEGNIKSEFSHFDVLTLAETVISTLKERADEKGVKLELNGEKTMISANASMLDELIYNLIDNGIKYNENNGEVVVEIKPDLKNKDFLIISVADAGIGIPKKHHARVFERFYRVDKSRSKKTGGTGLGLSIVKHVAEYHGGRVELESEEGVGTTIRCYIKKRP